MFQVVGLILCSEVGRLRRADFYYFIIADTSVTLAPAWCGKCRCSIMGLVYLVVRKQMMEMVFLLTTTLLFQYFSILVLLHTPPYGHPSFQRGMVCGVLKSQGIQESRYVLGSWFYFMLRSQETSESGEKIEGYYFYVPQEHQVCRLKITCDFKHRRCGRFSIFLDNPKARKFRRVCFY